MWHLPEVPSLGVRRVCPLGLAISWHTIRSQAAGNIKTGYLDCFLMCTSVTWHLAAVQYKYTQQPRSDGRSWPRKASAVAVGTVVDHLDTARRSFVSLAAYSCFTRVSFTRRGPGAAGMSGSASSRSHRYKVTKYLNADCFFLPGIVRIFWVPISL